MTTLRVFGHLIAKDIRIEMRGKQFLLSTVAFGVLLVLIVGIALDTAAAMSRDWSAGLLWLCLFFATSVSINRHDVKEREYGAQLGLLLLPVDRSLLFYAKWVSTCLFVLVSEIALVAAFLIILNQPLPARPADLAFVLLSGSVGLAGIGSFLSTLAAQSTMRDVLVPMLLFPLGIPLFIALIRLTVFTFASGSAHPAIWAEVVGAYIVAFAVLPWLLYEPLMEV